MALFALSEKPSLDSTYLRVYTFLLTRIFRRNSEISVLSRRALNLATQAKCQRKTAQNQQEWCGGTNRCGVSH